MADDNIVQVNPSAVSAAALRKKFLEDQANGPNLIPSGAASAPPTPAPKPWTPPDVSSLLQPPPPPLSASIMDAPLQAGVFDSPSTTATPPASVPLVAGGSLLGTGDVMDTGVANRLKNQPLLGPVPAPGSVNRGAAATPPVTAAAINPTVKPVAPVARPAMTPVDLSGDTSQPGPDPRERPLLGRGPSLVPSLPATDGSERYVIMPNGGPVVHGVPTASVELRPGQHVSDPNAAPRTVQTPEEAARAAAATNGAMGRAVANSGVITGTPLENAIGQLAKQRMLIERGQMGEGVLRPDQRGPAQGATSALTGRFRYNLLDKPVLNDAATREQSLIGAQGKAQEGVEGAKAA